MVLLVAGVAAPLTGCRLCCDLEDAAYSSYGGAWERTHRNSGRVGSLFDPAGAKSSQLVPRDSAADKSDARSRIAPLHEGESELPDAAPRQSPEIEKTEEETEQEFQERLRKFQQEKMLNAGVIPGDPTPPAFR